MLSPILKFIRNPNLITSLFLFKYVIYTLVKDVFNMIII